MLADLHLALAPLARHSHLAFIGDAIGFRQRIDQIGMQGLDSLGLIQPGHGTIANTSGLHRRFGIPVSEGQASTCGQLGIG